MQTAVSGKSRFIGSSLGKCRISRLPFKNDGPTEPSALTSILIKMTGFSRRPSNGLLPYWKKTQLDRLSASLQA
jgi:hypothetical protein